MDSRHCKVAIIGAGTAGLSAYKAALRHTSSLVLIEGGKYGTTCARNGCMPAKLLIAAAEAKRNVDESWHFGVEVSQVAVDGEKVMARMRDLQADFVGAIVDKSENLPQAHKMRGYARFLDPHTLDIDGQILVADAIVLATGSHPVRPGIFAKEDPRLLTTDELFDLKTLPASLAIVGGGAIGLELGQAFHHLGVRIKLFHANATLGPEGDPEITKAATSIFRKALPCVLSTEVQSLKSSDVGVELAWNDEDGRPQRETFEYVLVAAGRKPNLEKLDLARSGLVLDDKGIPSFDPSTRQCQNSHIFIAGDVDDKNPILHEASHEGRVAGLNAARYPEVKAIAPHTPLTIVFTNPQFAIVGVPLFDLDQSALAIGQVSFAEQGRSRMIGQNQGLGRIYGHRNTRKILGAQLLGPGAEHLAHLLAWVIELEATVDQVLKLPYYHPTIEEGLRTALEDLRRELDQ